MNLHYLAGLIDGEGSVGFSSTGVGKRRFVIEIKMVSKKLMEECQQAFGGHLQSRPSTNVNWKDQWRWRVQGKKAQQLYKDVSPMLRLK